MPYKVQFVGLVCFYREKNARQALLPDGRQPSDWIDPHYGTVLVDPDAVMASDGWPSDADTERGVYKFVPCSISIDGMDTPGELDTSGHDRKLPQLRDIDPSFEIDPERAETIARLHIRRGKLTAHTIPGGTAVMSQLQVPHDGEITITMTPRDGSPVRTLRLRPGTEILIGNMAEGGVYRAHQREYDHFRIYEKLSVRPVALHDPAEAPKLPPPQTSHWMFRRVAEVNLNISCSNTGCC